MLTSLATIAAMLLAGAGSASAATTPAVTTIGGLDPAAVNADLGMPYASGAALLTAYTAALTDKSLIKAACEKRATETPFKRYLDPMAYWRLPASSAWGTAGAATATGAGWVLGAGSSVTTPVFCTAINMPTFRLFAHGVAGGVLRAEVITPTGRVLLAGRVPLGRTMAPTPVFLLTASALAAASPTGSVDLRIRLTAEGAGIQVDELWIDPFKRI